MILAVDTSLGTAVAVIDAAGQKAVRADSPDPIGHAEVIGDLLQSVVTAGTETGADITMVVAGMGPGPFTGLRIGIATARAFALGRGLEVIGVPSHFAAALTEIEKAEIENGATGPFAIVTDARRRELAVSVFDGVDADGIPNLVSPTILVPRAEPLPDVRIVEVAQLDAAALAKVGQRAASAGRSLVGAEPLYLRAPDVSVPGAPKRVSG